MIMMMMEEQGRGYRVLAAGSRDGGDRK